MRLGKEQKQDTTTMSRSKKRGCLVFQVIFSLLYTKSTKYRRGFRKQSKLLYFVSNDNMYVFIPQLIHKQSVSVCKNQAKQEKQSELL